MTQLEKVRFFWMNELKLTQIELFPLFKWVTANVSGLFCVALKANERFFAIFYLFVLNNKLYIYVNSPVCAGENQHKCEKVRFF